MTLSIIIVNYKSKGLLKQCLRGIFDAQLKLDFEVIVVDNASRDGSEAMIRQHFPHVQVMTAPTNRGFGAGNNLGLAKAKGEYILVLTPDVAVFPGAVEDLHRYLVAHREVGLVGPKLINPDGTIQNSTYLFPSFLMAVFRRTPLGRLPGAKRQLKKYLMRDWQHDDTRPVGWLLGACFMARADKLRELGGFDERYFLYVEDTDLCRRFWASGSEVHYVHTAEMVHYHQRESAVNPGPSGIFSYPTRIHIRSWLTYFKKYRGHPHPPYSL